MLGALEAKVHALEEQLDGEVRFVKLSSFLLLFFSSRIAFCFSEKQKISRTVRTLEKRLRDAAALTDESRKQSDAFKDQVKRNETKLFFFF